MRITLRLVISYLVGFGLLLWGFLVFFTSAVGGVISILAGLIALPWVRQQFANKRNIELSGGLVAAIVVFGVIGSFGGLMLADESSEQFQEFDQQIRNEEIDVRNSAEEERRWVVEYYASSSGRLEEIGTIARIYSETVPTTEEDQDHRQLDIIILEADDSRLNSLSINAELARQYRNGEISEEEYSRRVLASVVL